MESQITYKEFIDNIINTRGRKGCDGYFETHHIIPKCLNGNNQADNLIDLYPSEHYIAHKLLALENPHNRDLLLAWNLMSRIEDKEITAEEFSILRERMAESLRGENNPMFGHKVDNSTKQKISESISGDKHWNYGNTGDRCVWYEKHHTQKTKDKMSASARGVPKSEEAKQHMRENNSKKIAVVCVETQEVFISSNEAGRSLGIRGSNINRCCKGERITAGGYH